MESGFFAVLIWVGEAGFAGFVIFFRRFSALWANGRNAAGVDFFVGGLAKWGGSHTFGEKRLLNFFKPGGL